MYRWHSFMNQMLRNQEVAILFTAQELRRMHRRTGHPSTNRLIRILEQHRSSHELNPEICSTLQKIAKSCKLYQPNSKPPQRFRFVLHNDFRFKYVISMNIMNLSDGNVHHVMCKGTKYQLCSL